MTDDEIQKSSEMTPAQQRMANARAARQVKRVEPAQAEQVTRQIKKPPLVADEPRPERRTVSRTADGRVEIEGRNGEKLSRTRVQVGDIFEIPANMIPKGWTYQWNAVSVAGNSEILLDQNHMMYQNGWRPVPAERYAGTLVPSGSKGNIIRGQQMLMERPIALTEEARQEDIRNATQLISDRNESLKLAGMKKSMPSGFADRSQGARIQIDRSLDVVNVNQSAGNYQLDE